MKRTRTGAWVIPRKQVKEFTTKRIDYNALILDCFPEHERRILQRRMTEYRISYNCNDLSIQRLKEVQSK